MKPRTFLLMAAVAATTISTAQTADDPVIMTIAGMPVLRSEFEYSYNKNNSEGVIDKKTVDEYADLFINYKLKVKAAEDARMDTLPSFRKEFPTYRDQQIRSMMITDDDVEREARKIYDETRQRVDNSGGLAKPAHILVTVRQTATDAELAAAKAKADSIYRVLQASQFDKDTFARLAAECSDDRGTARKGGELNWIQNGQTVPEFNDKVFSMQVGETSAPTKSVAGYHIIQLRDKRDFFPYDSMRTDILKYIDRRGIREQIISQKLEDIAQARGEGVTAEQVLAEKREEMEAADPDLRYLIQEYHDGLLLYEIATLRVWGDVSKDEEALRKFFRKNRKKYSWDEPHFKGIAFYAKDADDIARVKAAVKGLPFDEWNEQLRLTFNNDSVLRIKAEKGVFERGMNSLVDKYEFKTGTDIKAQEGYPYTATYGKMLKAPEDYTDVRSLVVNDYQEELEAQWIDELRKKYDVTVDKAVLATVNSH